MFRLVSKPSVAFSTVYDINGVDVAAGRVVDPSLFAKTGLRFGQNTETHRSPFPLHYHYLRRLCKSVPFLPDGR